MSLAVSNPLQPSWQFPQDLPPRSSDDAKDVTSNSNSLSLPEDQLMEDYYDTDTSLQQNANYSATQDQAMDKISHPYLTNALVTSDETTRAHSPQSPRDPVSTGSNVDWNPFKDSITAHSFKEAIMYDSDSSSSENEVDIPSELIPKRNLRAHKSDGLSQGFNTWVDKDETGNYDPEEEQKRLRKKCRRATKDVRRNDARNTDSGTNFDGSSRFTPSITCTLQFRSVEKKLAFAKLTSRLASLSKVLDHKAERTLRNNGREKRERISREYNLPDDLTGHPIRRGCYGCAGLGERCSMLDDERDWPCRTCVESGELDCDMIAPPTRKLACQSCKKNRLTCSFTFHRNQGESCHACIQKGFHCIAGPVEEFIQPRITYDRDWRLDPLPKKKVIKKWDPCLECSEAGRQCHFTSENDGISPCAPCQQHNLPCTMGLSSSMNIPPDFLEPPRRPSRPESTKSTHASAPAATRTSPTPPLSSLSSSVTTIHTSFAHPIHFNAAEPSSPTCDFCSSPIFPLLGLGRKHVSVMEFPLDDTDSDSSISTGWIETSGGHRAAGNVKATRLCVLCTTQRLRMILCENHDLRQISVEAPSGEEQEGVLEEIIRAVEGDEDICGAQQGLDVERLCSLCPSLANYECEGAEEEGEEGGAVVGCGLKLCECCMLVLMGAHEGKLDEMLASVDCSPSERRPLGFRADCELLRREGALMKCISGIGKQR